MLLHATQSFPGMNEFGGDMLKFNLATNRYCSFVKTRCVSIGYTTFQLVAYGAVILLSCGIFLLRFCISFFDRYCSSYPLVNLCVNIELSHPSNTKAFNPNGLCYEGADIGNLLNL